MVLSRASDRSQGGPLDHRARQRCRPAGQREITAIALDSGELACRHERSFAMHRAITALQHARSLIERRGQPEPDAALLVQQRPLSVYDQLIA